MKQFLIDCLEVHCVYIIKPKAASPTFLTTVLHNNINSGLCNITTLFYFTCVILSPLKDLGATQTQETTNQLAEDTSHDTTDMLAKEEHFIPLSNEQRSHGNDEEELLYEGDVAEEATKEEKDDQTDMNMSTDAADEAETANDETVEVRKDDSHVEALNEDSEKKEATKEETKDDIVQLHDMSSTEIEFDKKQNNMARYEHSVHKLPWKLHRGGGLVFSSGSRPRACASLRLYVCLCV